MGHNCNRTSVSFGHVVNDILRRVALGTRMGRGVTETQENTNTLRQWISVIQRRPVQRTGTIMSFEQGKHLIYFKGLHLR